MPTCLFFLIYSIIQISNATPRIDPLVKTNVGLIRGLQSDDGTYSMFLGIPYAKIDTKNPFGPHLPQPPFEETFNAFDDSTMCPQKEEFNNTITGTLDCLHLNVYVPETATSSNPLPVMVWIHGGGFDYGYGGRIVQGPAYLVKHDVILVTLNYRLNVYGFMCLDIPEVPGNQGLRDQETALIWVKNNIAAFGGDENLITLIGESAGAASVDLQLRYGKGNLFNKIIMQSGSASSNWGIQVPDYKAAIKLAKELGYETADSKDAIEYLSITNPHEVVSAYLKSGLEIWPCVENEFFGIDRFITDYAINVEIEQVKTTPILLGNNNEEWLCNYIHMDDEEFQKLNIFQNSLAQGFNFTEEEMYDMEALVKHFYMGDNILSVNFSHEVANFETDFSMLHPAERSIKKYFSNGAKSIHHYVFSYNGNRNFVKRNLNALHVDGAFHADELGYLFEVSFFEKPNEEDQLTIDRLTSMWTNFVKFSDPTPEITDLIPVKWPAVTPQMAYYLNIGQDLVVSSRPFHDRMAFWDLFFKLNEKRQIGYKQL